MCQQKCFMLIILRSFIPGFLRASVIFMYSVTSSDGATVTAFPKFIWPGNAFGIYLGNTSLKTRYPNQIILQHSKRAKAWKKWERLNWFLKQSRIWKLFLFKFMLLIYSMSWGLPSDRACYWERVIEIQERDKIQVVIKSSIISKQRKFHICWRCFLWGKKCAYALIASILF